MSAYTQIPKDHPVMIAWEAFKADAEFENTKRWAMCSEGVVGSLWAAFYAGYDKGVRDGIDEAMVIATEQARLMADVALDGLPENAREREAMEAALTRFTQKLSVTLEDLSAREAKP